MTKINEDKMYEAIREGVRDAFWQMITNGTDMPCQDFFEFVKKGVEDGVFKAMPNQDDILAQFNKD